MKQLLLAAALIAMPAVAFTGFTLSQSEATVSATDLGDLTPMKTIIGDVQTIAAKGDFVAAAARITDFETAWDDAAATMRPLNTAAWGNVDAASDSALSALRSASPKADDVTAGLTALLAALDNPAGGAQAAPVAATMVSGIAVTDETGRALPCEDMLKTLGAAMASASLSGADKTAAEGFQTKALERCNADDDQHADEGSAQALAIVGK